MSEEVQDTGRVYAEALKSLSGVIEMVAKPATPFALVRVAVRLSFGDAAASKILKDLGFGFYLDLLSENNEPTF